MHTTFLVAASQTAIPVGSAPCWRWTLSTCVIHVCCEVQEVPGQPKGQLQGAGQSGVAGSGAARPGIVGNNAATSGNAGGTTGQLCASPCRRAAGSTISPAARSCSVMSSDIETVHGRAGKGPRSWSRREGSPKSEHWDAGAISSSTVSIGPGFCSMSPQVSRDPPPWQVPAAKEVAAALGRG